MHEPIYDMRPYTICAHMPSVQCMMPRLAGQRHQSLSPALASTATHDAQAGEAELNDAKAGEAELRQGGHRSQKKKRGENGAPDKRGFESGSVIWSGLGLCDVMEALHWVRHCCKALPQVR